MGKARRRDRRAAQHPDVCVEELKALNLPFLFRDTAHMEKVIDGTIGQELLDKVSNNSNPRLIGLAWMEASACSVYDTKKPIKSIDDLQGLKMRVMGNPMFVDMMNSLGGNGVAMGYHQVFSALQTAPLCFRQPLPAHQILYSDRAFDRVRDPGVLAGHLGQPLERRRGAGEKVDPLGATGRAPAVEESRRGGHGQVAAIGAPAMTAAATAARQILFSTRCLPHLHVLARGPASV